MDYKIPQKYLCDNISPKCSQTLSGMRAICVIIIVLLHSSIAHLVSPENAYIFNGIIRHITNCHILEIMFIISGFLFFAKEHTLSKNIYIKKLKSRIKSLLIPYILWCILGYIHNILLGTEYEGNILDQIQHLFWGSPILTGSPAGKALWFIRNLIVFALFSPIYYAIVKYLKHFTLIIIFFSSLFISSKFPFFNPYILLGVYLAINKISIEKICNRFPDILIFFVTAIIYILYCFRFIPGLIITMLLFIILYRIVERTSTPRIFITSSTFLYMSHLYITGPIKTILIAVLPNNIICNIFALIATFVLTIMICIGTYIVLKKSMPRFLGIITGGRI